MQRKYSLDELLPKINLNSWDGIIKILKSVIFFCNSIASAMESLKRKEFSFFDAQVSDNLCQIRAYQLSNYIEAINQNNKNNFNFLIKKASELKDKSNFLLNELIEKRSKKDDLILKETNIEKFLSDFGMQLYFSEEEFLFVSSFILSKYKSFDLNGIPVGVDFDRLNNEIDIESRTYARKFIHHLQRVVSKNSCEFVLNISKELDITNKQSRLLFLLKQKDEIGRELIPSYAATNVILQHANSVNNKVFNIIVERIGEDWMDNFEFSIYKGENEKLYSASSRHKEGIQTEILVKGVTYYAEKTKEGKEEYIERFGDAANLLFIHFIRIRNG